MRNDMRGRPFVLATIPNTKFTACVIQDTKYRVIFLTGPALKVLSVGDGKIPTKKVKVRECHRNNVKFNSNFHFFCRDFAISNT